MTPERRIKDLEWQSNFAKIILKRLSLDNDRVDKVASLMHNAERELPKARERLLDVNLKPLRDDIDKARSSHSNVKKHTEKLTDTLHGVMGVRG